MPAKAKYPTPHEQLLALAVQARRRGLPFPEFWLEAVRPLRSQPQVMFRTPRPPEGAVRWPNDTDERAVYRAATIEAEGAWQRAYDREPPQGPEEALAMLAPILAAVDRAADAAARAELAGGNGSGKRVRSAA